MSGCVKVWLPISWPSRTTRCISPIFSAASAPIIMKVPFTLRDFENVEDFRSPLGVGSVVEADGDLVGVIAVVLNVVGVRIHIHVLVDSDAAILCVIFNGAVGRLHFNGAGAIGGPAGDAENVSVAFRINVVPGHKLLERVGSILAAGLVPHGPQRTIF